MKKVMPPVKKGAPPLPPKKGVPPVSGKPVPKGRRGTDGGFMPR